MSKKKTSTPEIPTMGKSPVDFLHKIEADQACGLFSNPDLAAKADAILANPDNSGVVYVTHCSHGSHGSHGGGCKRS